MRKLKVGDKVRIGVYNSNNPRDIYRGKVTYVTYVTYIHYYSITISYSLRYRQ